MTLTVPLKPFPARQEHSWHSEPLKPPSVCGDVKEQGRRIMPENIRN